MVMYDIAKIKFRSSCPSFRGIGPIVGERTVQGSQGGWGDMIKVSGYECTRPLAICYLERPVARPRCWATTRANRVQPDR